MEARLAHVGTGEPADYDDRDVAGAIVLVERNVTFHRSAQYREAVARGARGLVYISQAPDNLVEKLIAPGKLVQIGLRSTWGKPTDPDFARAHDARQIPMEEIEERGMAAVSREVHERLGNGPLYVSFDVDAIDPAFAPGTGTPVPGGMTSREALQLLRSLRGLNLAGMDLVEICPALDHADLTCHLGAHLLFEGLALLA